MSVLLIFILLILLLGLIIFFYDNNIEQIKFEQIKESSGDYMNKDELYEYLIKDGDNYMNNFSPIDLKVRNINNIEEYKHNIKKSVIDISDSNKIILNKCITLANEKLNKIKLNGFDGIKCANIKWTIGLINGKLYEEGFPHTRYNVIIIPLSSLKNKEKLVDTLIHEKIHVYQKMYSDDIDLYLKSNGFTKFKLRKEFTNTRSNPDMDEWIYKNKNNQIMIAEYNNNPTSIMDVKIQPIDNSKYEHPFEYMAYDITSNITSNH